MRSQSVFIKTFSLVALVICGCQKTPISNLEDKLTFYYETGPEIKENEILTIWLYNQTNICISFPSDFGAKIYAETKDGPLQVENNTKVIGNQPWIFDPKIEISLESPMSLRPDISKLALAKPINFFIIVNGYLCSDKNVSITKKIPFSIIQ